MRIIEERKERTDKKFYEETVQIISETVKYQENRSCFYNFGEVQEVQFTQAPKEMRSIYADKLFKGLY